MSTASLEERLEALRDARVVLVSACLLGVASRYDGADRRDPRVVEALRGKEVVPLCPEAGAGLPVPRPAVELRGGDGADVLAGQARAQEREGGADRTSDFLKGAELALEAALSHGATVAILKEGSPSCGSRRVWRDGALAEGEGVTAHALRAAGVVVVSDEELTPG